jgi:hypothetical protein
MNTLSGSEADLLALMCADRAVQDKRRADQAAASLEADKEIDAEPARRRQTWA